MDRLEAMALRLPEAERVDIEAWDGEPTFRVRGKNFVFTDPDGDLGDREAAQGRGRGGRRVGSCG